MRIRYWFTEAAQLELRGKDPACCLNTLTEQGAAFTDACCPSPGLVRLTVEGRDLPKAQAAAEAQGFALQVIKRRGLFLVLRRFQGRWLLIAAPWVLLLAVLLLSSYIWELEVVGNQTLTRAEIIDALAAEGVAVGTSGLHIDNEQLRSHMQQRLGKLIWLTVHVQGSRAQVMVRERRDRLAIVDETTPGDVVAGRTGLIVRMSVLEGKPLARKGDMVLAGETLITGNLTDRQEERRHVHALGQVWARTWYRIALEMPLDHTEKAYTGRETVKTALKICNFRVNFYADSGISYAAYDKMQWEHRPSILGLSLPVSLLRTRYTEYTPLADGLEPADCEALLKERLLIALRQTSGGAEPTETMFETTEANGTLRVCLTAECLEQIGRETQLN